MEEQVIEAGNLDEVLQKENEETQKTKKPIKNAIKNGTIKGLKLNGVVVIYRDELGRIVKEKVSLIVPYVEDSWLQVAARKALSLYFDDNAILPQIIMSVRIPKTGIEETEIEASFLKKPISQLNKKECVWAAIYYKFRTVTSALNGMEEDMQKSLSRHYENRNKGEDIRNWTNPIDLTKKLKEIK